jgi:sigma-B regulation protein RsbU (phosphoserine phosphatase)
MPQEKKVQCCNDISCTIDPIIAKHDEALEQIEHGEFGKCTKCSGEVELERLELDFTTQVCLSHYSDNKLKTLERDLELAAKVQKQLLPHMLPALKGIKIAAHTEPAEIVGGDYFDFFPYTNGAQGIAVADVMGKGLAASMLMSNLQASLRILGPDHHELDKLAGRLNELFRYNVKLISFITLFLLKIDTKANTLQYCNAGHNPALYWNSKSKELTKLNSTGPAIGLANNIDFNAEEFHYSEGDLLLLYTDGITEARNADKEEFGETRLETYLKENLDKNADAIISGLRQKAKDFCGKLQDDATLLVVKF